MSKPQDWAVFLDRDGTINEEVNYLGDPAQLKLTPGAAKAIHLLNSHHIPVIVVTNQAGIARGYFTIAQMHLVHHALDAMLAPDNAKIDAYYFCPHHPTAGIGEYKISCTCRKPEPGMFHQAAQDLHLDLTKSYLVGDKLTDIQAGNRAGCRTVLVETGYGKAESTNCQSEIKPDRISPDLLEATDWILTQFQDRSNLWRS
jgi:D-glycero-D-manno-heptose 1,7-bisphosphate phosphatase